MGDRVLDQALIKDLSNHIYEKRKATAFQIESITKSALAANDSAKIYKIINELVELTNDGTNSAKMGAITALGSVSVALGSFAIAYFLKEIIKPIFATFKDTDARVRYYACESLYNIAKIARGEILLYFNEVFDILCILVTDSESSVKNAADILDRLIKDIVSAKATSYVSILQEQEQEDQFAGKTSEIKSHIVGTDGVALQVNEEQDTMKAFSLPKFIPTLLERMYIIDPFAKMFLLGWLELFDDIPSLELITFLPNFLDPLIKFLTNNAPADVRLETENLLNIFLKEVKSIARVKYEVKRKHLVKEREKLIQNQKKLKEDQIADIRSDEKVVEDINQLAITDTSSIKSNSTTIVHPSEEKGSQLNLVKLQQDQNKLSLLESKNEDLEDDTFLTGQDIFIDYPKIIEILLSFLRHQEKGEIKSYDLSNEPHEISIQIQLISLKWLQEILLIAPTGYIKYLPFCISVIMQNLATTDLDKDYSLQQQFLNFNSSLKKFIIRLGDVGKNPDNEEFSLYGLTKDLHDEFFENHLKLTVDRIINEYLYNPSELGKITSLDWLIFLYGQDSINFMKVINLGRFDTSELLKPLTQVKSDVILKVLQLFSRISENNDDFFRDFIYKLLLFSKQHEPQNRVKIEFIIRKLCVSLDPEKIYKTLSEVLLQFDDLDFLNSMVVTLNNILLTSQELFGFRKKLKSLDVYKLDDWSIFATLFQSWCHNAPLALSLCFLTSNYELAYLIIKSISELEVTYQLLVQLDILIQLIESPIFLKLRLQLLEPDKNPYLYKTLYGLLMILPQSTTFNTLKNRLNSTANLLITGMNIQPNTTVTLPTSVGPSGATSSTAPSTPGIVPNQLSIKKKRIYEMLDKFVKVHNKHEEYTINKRLKDPEETSSQYRSEKLTGYTSSFVEKKDYFSTEPDRKPSKPLSTPRVNR